MISDEAGYDIMTSVSLNMVRNKVYETSFYVNNTYDYNRSQYNYDDTLDSSPFLVTPM